MKERERREERGDGEKASTQKRRKKKKKGGRGGTARSFYLSIGALVPRPSEHDTLSDVFCSSVDVSMSHKATGMPNATLIHPGAPHSVTIDPSGDCLHVC